MNLSAEQKQNKRVLILSEGLRLMHAKGYNATGVKDVTDAAGVPKGSFYNYFKSKEDFAIEAMRYYYEMYAAPGNEILKRTDIAPLDRLRQYFERNRKAIIEVQDYSMGCFVNNMCQEMADQSDEISGCISKHFQCTRGAIATCLHEAQSAGEIPADLDADMLAQFIDNAWRGVITSAKAEHSESDFDGFMELVFNKLLK